MVMGIAPHPLLLPNANCVHWRSTFLIANAFLDVDFGGFGIDFGNIN